MARSYKRDKNGRFASGGSSSTGRAAASARMKRGTLGIERSGNRTRSVSVNETLGTKRSGNRVSGVKMSDRMAAKTAKNSYGNPNHRASGTVRKGNTVRKSRRLG